MGVSRVTACEWLVRECLCMAVSRVPVNGTSTSACNWLKVYMPA